MLSAKLIHLIESHGDEITGRVLRHIRQDSEMTHIRSLPEAELREWGQSILHNLGHWLSAGNERELAVHYDRLGRLRYDEDVPLHEAVRGLSILKNKMADFVQEQCLAKTALDAFAEEELERRVDRFFDLLVFHLVRGYEAAMRETTRLSARASRS